MDVQDGATRDNGPEGAWLYRWAGEFREAYRAFREGDLPVQFMAARDVARLMAELRRAFAHSAAPDEPIADPTERAKAVAKILRGRGLTAEAEPGMPFVRVALGSPTGDLCWTLFRMAYYDPDWPVDPRPRACADKIQELAAASEMRRAGDGPPETKEALCTCPAASEYDPPCPQHGVLGIGVTGRG